MNAAAKSTRTRARSTAAILAATVAAATIAAGVSLMEARSAEASGTRTTVEGYRATLAPLQSVGLPDMKCPAGAYLYRANYSAGRLVPHGVQVIEPGGVGVTISGATFAATQPTGLPIRVQVYDATTGPSSATNWDLSSHPLVINIICTTNPWDAAYDYLYHVRD